MVGEWWKEDGGRLVRARVTDWIQRMVWLGLGFRDWIWVIVVGSSWVLWSHLLDLVNAHVIFKVKIIYLRAKVRISQYFKGESLINP